MRHAVGVILIRKEDGAVLIQHRDSNPGTFNPDYFGYPGGGIDDEKNKDYEGEARKELEEESDYIVDVLYLLTEKDFTRPDGVPIRKHVYWAIYDGKQKITCKEGLEMKFLTIDDLKGRKIIPEEAELCHLAVNQAREKGLLKEIKRDTDKIKLF
jgi:ADP-ribose pyrophosphatase YjhB (NUDIX family)